MPVRMKVDLGPGHIVLDGDPDPLLKKGAEPPPQFSALVCCGQRAGWITMPLGMEVGLDPSDFVLDEDLAPPRRDTAPKSSCRGQTAGWMKMPLGTKVGLGPGRIVLHGDPASLPKGA